LIRTTITMPM